jgi:alcohol dehydrogenase, propanol-preferring
MILTQVGKPLQLAELPLPEPDENQLLVRVRACGVCRTDLHIVGGELDEPKLPLVPGHQIAGEVAALGKGVQGFELGDRVGVPWLGYACGRCRYCLRGQENLCDEAGFTGYHLDGGYAEYAVADHRFTFRLPAGYGDPDIAPLLCAGLIGYRAYRMAGKGRRLGLYGFGAAAHILAQIARYEGREVCAFTRPGDSRGQAFALGLGATWAGGADELPPQELDAAIIFAPAGQLVPAALRAVAKGGIVVCGGIHMSDIPSFPYRLLWKERVLRSVANLTRQDALDFLELAPKVPVRTSVTTFALSQANEALEALGKGKLDGAAVLTVSTA